MADSHYREKESFQREKEQIIEKYQTRIEKIKDAYYKEYSKGPLDKLFD
jgi:hypothetical protein